MRGALELEDIKVDILKTEEYERDQTGAEVLLIVKKPSTFSKTYILDLKELVEIEEEVEA